MRLIFIVNSDKFFVSHWILIARFLMSKGFKIYVLTNYSRHRESILRLGFETIHFPFNRTSANPFVSIYQSIKLAKVFFSYKPTFVYSIGMSSNLTVIFAHLFFFFRNISFVYSITGLGHIFTTRTWSNRLISFFVKIFFYFISLRSNVAFLVENKFLVNLLSSHWFIDKKKIFLVPGAGIDPSYYMCNNFPSFDNSFRVLFFGRLLSEKGINEFYKASLFLSKNAPNVEMIIAGNIDDNPSSISAETLSDWSKQPNITYIGNLINDPHFLCDFHLIVLPSYSEGLPRSLIEALASSKPIIASDIPGCNDIVIDGFNGFLVPVRNSIMLADKIHFLSLNPDICLSFSKSSREHFMNHFTSNHVKNAINDVLKFFFLSK